MNLSSLSKKLIRKPQSGKFLPVLDGLRFLAIVPVILQHANERLFKYGEIGLLSGWEEFLSFFISRGTIGVFLFFAISGFILSLPFAQNRQQEPYGSYIKRRLIRIEPPFLLWMSFFAIILLIKEDYPGKELLGHFLASITYTHQLFYGEYSIINPVAWSLEVEIQYYLIAPFLAKFYFNIQNVMARRWAFGYLIFAYLLFQHGMGWHLMPFKASLLGQLPHFLIGMLAADFFTNPVLKGKSFLWDLFFPGLVLLLAFTWTEELWKSILFEMGLLGVFFTAFYGKIIPKILSNNWVVIIGGMCYSLYLTHLPLLEGFYLFIGKFGHWSGYFGQLSISLIIVLPIIFLCGVIAYRWIEQPFMTKAKAKLEVEKIPRTAIIPE
ncbi:acyltransferase family protein [Algoriphagus formosus]|uniref:Acyltransferase n=1 Tax=Algoriphagus formosus TaxID=2007308 RepID=A0A4R5UXW4_9BACT|nr:acyltransferase [Algoriphagus aquimaris]TDK44203.1 acyltransferase [Algoriphagus aquimaris]